MKPLKPYQLQAIEDLRRRFSVLTFQSVYSHLADVEQQYLAAVSESDSRENTVECAEYIMRLEAEAELIQLARKELYN